MFTANSDAQNPMTSLWACSTSFTSLSFAKKPSRARFRPEAQALTPLIAGLLAACTNGTFTVASDEAKPSEEPSEEPDSPRVELEEVFLFCADDDCINSGVNSAFNFASNNGERLVIGGNDDDRLFGGAGDDVILGGAGDDLLVGGKGTDILYGGSGTDTVSYASDTEGVTVSLFNGFAVGSGGDAEGDILRNIENLIGGAGNDVLTSDTSTGRANLDGGLGDDTLNIIKTEYTPPFITFTILDGGPGDDILNGRALSNDILIGGPGADMLNGYGGNDTASYVNDTVGVRVALFLNAGDDGEAEGDTYGQIDNVTGGFGDDYLRGNDSNNVLEGGPGINRLGGRGGNDTFVFNLVPDPINASDTILDFTAGEDRIKFIVGYAEFLSITNTLNFRIMLNVNWRVAGQDTVIYRPGKSEGVEGGGAAVDTILITLSAFTQDITGRDIVIVNQSGTEKTLSNLIEGTSGDEVLQGTAGDDTLIGGAGADQLFGGTDGTDTASYVTSSAGVTVDLSSQNDDGLVEGTGGDAAGDILVSIENLTGSAAADVLTGDNSANELNGLAGDDTLVGGAGRDTLIGGAGADVLDGGSGSDLASYVSSLTGVYVDLSLPTQLAFWDHDGDSATALIANGDAAGDTLLNIENLAGSAYADTLNGSSRGDIIYGLHGEDRLNGGAGDDRIFGGELSDTLDGGAGNDLLWGQSGDDIFVLSLAPDSGLDVVYDFVKAEDKIRIDLAHTVHNTVDGILLTAGLTVDQSSGSTVFRYGNRDIFRLEGFAEEFHISDFEII